MAASKLPYYIESDWSVDRYRAEVKGSGVGGGGSGGSGGGGGLGVGWGGCQLRERVEDGGCCWVVAEAVRRISKFFFFFFFYFYFP